MIATLKGAGKQCKSGEQEIVALQPTDLVLNEGELLLIMGPSGSGKTTLLSLLGCVIYPSFGDLWVDGKQVNKLKPRELAALRLNAIGFVFQNFNLLSRTPAIQQVELPLIYGGKGNRRQKAIDALTRVGLADRIDHRPSELSGGQQQRVAIARALVNDPAIILADEPTGNLDSKSGIEVMALLQELNQKQGITIILVTHDPKVAARCHRTIHMADGVIIREDSQEKMQAVASVSGGAS